MSKLLNVITIRGELPHLLKICHKFSELRKDHASRIPYSFGADLSPLLVNLRTLLDAIKDELLEKGWDKREDKVDLDKIAKLIPRIRDIHDLIKEWLYVRRDRLFFDYGDEMAHLLVGMGTNISNIEYALEGEDD